MTLSELLERDLVLVKTSCTSKDELIIKLLDKVYSKGEKPPFSQDEILKKIQIREKIGGTVFPSGLSAPHARLLDYENFALAVGTPMEPLFHEGIQIHLMALMISSQSGGLYYLPALAGFTRISRDKEYFTRLCGAQNLECFYSILQERDPELG